MKRAFYHSYRMRIPRKLKKAAKYGVEHHTLHPFYSSIVKEDDSSLFEYRESHVWIIKGRRTKWKVKAQAKCANEFRVSQKEIKEAYLKTFFVNPIDIAFFRPLISKSRA